jgi:hypothetical protein
MAIWYISWLFGIFFTPFWYIEARKIWQPCSKTGERFSDGKGSDKKYKNSVDGFFQTLKGEKKGLFQVSGENFSDEKKLFEAGLPDRTYIQDTKNPNLGIFWKALEWKMLVYFSHLVLYGHLVYFMADI